MGFNGIAVSRVAHDVVWLCAMPERRQFLQHPHRDFHFSLLSVELFVKHHAPYAATGLHRSLTARCTATYVAH